MKNTRVPGTFQLLLFGLILLVACNRSANETNPVKIERGSFTDPRDGKIYKTVKIGDQWIMAENLAYKTDTGNYWAYENIDSNVAIYGYLYDWETAMNSTPPGWHLPSGDEWKALRITLGCKNDRWRNLEEIYPKLIVGGSSGLDMLPGGMRTCDGEFTDLGIKARFWSSTTSVENRDAHRSNKMVYGLDNYKEGAPHSLGSKGPYLFYNSQTYTACCGFSVRLFRD